MDEIRGSIPRRPIFIFSQNYQKDYIVIFLTNPMGNEELIINKLDVLKREIEFIKEHIMDVTLTQNDTDSLNDAEVDLKKGRAKRL
ncbi:hypothetical protein COV15_03290 [Candidatus Woesearchaeota archaeon CG10_big_fil_rev_8_21_14_0_10_34_12]|nr:MAG: hypothetical protein COV15_03290 [Candidatus Woesearchaeota archaeon CG10_big_fil_rev_8_21_14_0_10_34_12]